MWVFAWRARRSAVLLAVLVFCGCPGGNRPVPVLPVESRESTPSPADAAPQRLQFKDHNLVFVSFDALQAAHVGSYGYHRDVTPTIDAFARSGYRFTRVNSVASWTVPSSMTWFTGVYPCEHRMTNKFAEYNQLVQRPANLKELSPNLVTLAEVLRQAGYATGGFTGNAGVSGGFGYEQGFDRYFYEPGKFGGFDVSLPMAIEWSKANKDRNFFLFLHGYDCHGQFVPKEEFDGRFVEPGYSGRFRGTAQEQELLREEGLELGALPLPDADVRFWRAIYDEKIQRADERFQRFLKEFEKLGLMDKTIFVLTSDHGTELYEHRRFDHGFTLYDEQLHVPLVVKLPGQREGRTVVDRVSSIDLMPTLLDLLEVDPGPARGQLRGTSLVPAMRGEPANRDCFSETDYREYTFKRAIVKPDGWKLIVTLESQTRELYDLNTDPEEKHNRAESEPGRVRELEADLYAHFRSIGHDLKLRNWTVGLNPVYKSQAEPRKINSTRPKTRH